jgi:hypothetical protein
MPLPTKLPQQNIVSQNLATRSVHRQFLLHVFGINNGNIWTHVETQKLKNTKQSRTRWESKPGPPKPYPGRSTTKYTPVLVHVMPEFKGRDSDSLRVERSGDRIPVVTRFFAPIQTGPEAHPASCTMGIGPFPGVKAARAWRSPTPISAEVMKSTAVPLLHLWTGVACYRVKPYLTLCLSSGNFLILPHNYVISVRSFTAELSSFDLWCGRGA